MDVALEAFPSVQLAQDSARSLCHGQAVAAPRAACAGLVRLYDDEGEFLGVGEVQDDGTLAPRRLLAAAE